MPQPRIHLPSSELFPGDILLGVGVLLAGLGLISGGLALAAGLLLGLTLGHGQGTHLRKITPRLLGLSVAGLGAELELRQVLTAGLRGAGFALVSISLVLGIGLLAIRYFGVPRRVGLLVSIGTAICGGSAIAAAAPVLAAEESEVGLALTTVFMLNAAALWIFPPLGHWAALSPSSFGLWAALGIHDTSSVVGAALAYGPGAVAIATTTKLARALWIVPLTLGLSLFTPKSAGPRTARPWFILGFIAMAAIVTFIPTLRPLGHDIATVSRRLLVITLFLIGAGITRTSLSKLGWRPVLLGLGLWFVLGVGTFCAVYSGVITH